MNKRIIITASVILSVIAVILIAVFALRGAFKGTQGAGSEPSSTVTETESSSETETVSDTDDENWTSIYEATPVE